MERTRDLSLPLHLSVGLFALLVPIAGIAHFARLDETVSARGRLEFTALTPATTRIGARIERVLCREGERVVRGAALFELDREELRARHDELVARARGLREQREHIAVLRRVVVDEEQPRELIRERRELAASAIDVELKHKLWSPRLELLAREAGSGEEAMVARLGYEAASTRRDAAVATTRAVAARQRRDVEEIDRSLAAVNGELQAVEASLPLAERWLVDATVRAPIDGIVLTANPERLRGKRVEPGETIVEIADPRELRFVMEVDERDVSRVIPGEDVVLSFDAFPFYVYRAFHGSVSEVSHLPLAVGSADIANRFRVLVAVEDPRIEIDVAGTHRTVDLRPGLSGEGSVFVNCGLDLGTFLLRSLERRRLPKSFTIY